jgi:hypothetical protein
MINDQLQTQLKINTTLLEAFNKLLVTGNASIPDFVISLGNLHQLQMRLLKIM